MMKRWFFTFGQIHVHPKTGEAMKDYYIIVYAKTREKARELMCSKYLDRWAFQYDEHNFNSTYYIFKPKKWYEILTERN